MSEVMVIIILNGEKVQALDRLQCFLKMLLALLNSNETKYVLLDVRGFMSIPYDEYCQSTNLLNKLLNIVRGSF